MPLPKDTYPKTPRRHPDGRLDTTPAEDVLQPRLEGELQRLAPTKATVLLVGGDEATRAAFARALHDRSPRARGPFVVVDCAALTLDEADRVLFGGPTSVRAGAAFGAVRGTLYLAAVADLPLSAQPRLFSFLDEDTNVRVVASSPVGLDDAVADGRLRAELGRRLQLVAVVFA